MRVYHIERRDGTSRCNKAKHRDSLIPMDAPMSEDAEGDIYASWNSVNGGAKVGRWAEDC